MIKQIALDRFSAEGLMKMLPVNIDQQFAEGLELLDGHGVAVDERSGAAVGGNYPPQQACIVLVKRIFFEPCPGVRYCRHIELGTEFRSLRAAADEFAAAAFTQYQPERVDEYRLARTCFARKDRHAGGEFRGNAIDDRKIANLQIDEHV